MSDMNEDRWDYKVNVCTRCLAEMRVGPIEAEPVPKESRARCYCCGARWFCGDSPFSALELRRVPWFEIASKLAAKKTETSQDGGMLCAQCHRCGSVYLGALGSHVVCSCEQPGPLCETIGVSRVYWPRSPL